MSSRFSWLRTLCRGPAGAFLVLAAIALAGCSGFTLPGFSSHKQAPAPVQAPVPVVAAPAPPRPLGPLPLGPGEKVAVGLLLPLSGPNEALGRGLLDAAETALFDVPGARLSLMPRDTKGTAEGAAAAARDAIEHGARILIGPLTAPEVESVKPIAAARGIPVLAFSTSAELAGNGTYLMGFLPADGVRRVVNFAHEKGVLRVAVLAPQTAYGQVVAAALKDAAIEEKITVTDTVFFDPATVDLAPSVRELAHYDSRKAALDQQRRQLERARDPASVEALKRLNEQILAGDLGFDAVLLPEGGQRIKTLAPLLPYYGIDPARVHFLGTGLWDDPALLTEPELQGAWYAAADPAGRADFERQFQSLYGHAPPRLATLAYDATALAAALSRNDPPDYSAAVLTNPNGFLGLDGIFRLRPDGRVERGLAVLEIRRTGAAVVNPAPTAFVGY